MMSSSLDSGLFTLALASCVVLIWLLGVGRRWFVGRGSTLRPSRARSRSKMSPEKRVRSERTSETMGALLFTTAQYVVVAFMIFLALSQLLPDTQAPLIWFGLVVAVVGFSAQQVLRDLIAGVMMTSERWFEVGDYITIEPWQVSGVVEAFTFRMTKLRTITGERAVFHNAQIYGARIVPKGVREMQLELYTADPDRAEELIREVSDMLPSGSTSMVRPLAVSNREQVSSGLWRIVADAAAPPGREWLVEKFAVNTLAELDEEHVITHGPLVMYQDAVAERRFAQATSRARRMPGSQTGA